MQKEISFYLPFPWNDLPKLPIFTTLSCVNNFVSQCDDNTKRDQLLHWVVTSIVGVATEYFQFTTCTATPTYNSHSGKLMRPM